ncbi:MAG TPA: DUF3014 domain-containing protein [Vicinamibacterales bacterium]|jgi:hypothetical protein|nr:DUF3014 domain-containing protein [Vicinamibacterales bacterium]
MNDLPDYEIQRPASEPPPPAPTQRPSAFGWILVAVVIVAAGLAVYFGVVRGRRPAPAPATTVAPKAPTDTSTPPLGGTGEAITLPALDSSDDVVRTLVRRISEHPAVAAWLTTSGLVRNFTVVVVNIADGATPVQHLKVLRPSASFRVVQRDGTTFVDERSYDRYTSLADAIASIDPAAAARLYGTLKPRIDEAARDLGSSDPSFDRTLERAIVSLLDTPIRDGPAKLTPKGIGYAYDDGRLEGLTSAQKQLLRMGPRNARIVQKQLRAIALALGIPAAHLPSR